jgi:hypothetical protein
VGLVNEQTRPSSGSKAAIRSDGLITPVPPMNRTFIPIVSFRDMPCRLHMRTTKSRPRTLQNGVALVRYEVVWEIQYSTYNHLWQTTLRLFVYALWWKRA